MSDRVLIELSVLNGHFSVQKNEKLGHSFEQPSQSEENQFQDEPHKVEQNHERAQQKPLN